MSSSGRKRRWEESRGGGIRGGGVMKGGKEIWVQTERNRRSGRERMEERSQIRKTGDGGERGVEDGGSW